MPGAEDAARRGRPVVHVNDIARVGPTLVDAAVRRGLDWRFHPLPDSREVTGATLARARLADLVRTRARLPRDAVLHVHYGAYGYYGVHRRAPVVLHFHGSDLRVDLRSRLAGPVVRAASHSADALLASTPDLVPEIEAELGRRPLWLPAPVAADLLDGEPPGPPQGGHPRVLFLVRWDPVKGAGLLAEAAQQLIATTDADVVGIGWGRQVGLAHGAGVRLLPLQPPAALRELVSSSAVVVGQQLAGALGVSELEALALCRPLVTHFTQEEAYGSAPPLWEGGRSAEGVAEAVRSLLADPAAAEVRAARGRAWVARHHHPDVLVDRLLDLYSTL